MTTKQQLAAGKRAAAAAVGLAHAWEEFWQSVRDLEAANRDSGPPAHNECAPGCDFPVTGYHAKRGGRVLCGEAAGTGEQT